VVEIFPAGAADRAIRCEWFGDEIDRISEFDPFTGEILAPLDQVAIYPASHYVVDDEKRQRALVTIEAELEIRLRQLREADKLLEAQRLEQRTRNDLEMLREIGFCTGIENYSRHLTGRPPGESPFTLLDFFPDDFLMVIDESHVSIPQVGAMYNGDKARKDNLIDFGFRLPSAADNRPLKFGEFEGRLNQVIYASATPGPYELGRVEPPAVVQQIVRPTGLLDPELEIRPIKGQIDDLYTEIKMRATKQQRTLVTTLTKKMAEDLTDYLKELGVKVRYMHSDIETIERMQIVRDLRLGVFDVLVGINLLREGLDIPEVSLVAILDADKEGFLRSERSLIQTIGRAARNVEGRVIMYADRVTDSMKKAINVTNDRRAIQAAYNQMHGITPQTVIKPVRNVLQIQKEQGDAGPVTSILDTPKKEIPKLVDRLRKEMKEAAKNLEFERAAELRDLVIELEKRR
jgi:excinuclease ABC subunit B